jgi:hypothetical protein
MYPNLYQTNRRKMIRQTNDNSELSLMNIPRLQRCDFQGVCDNIGLFLSPQEFDNLSIFRNAVHNFAREPAFDRNQFVIAPLDLSFEFDLEKDFDDSWWLQDEDEWDAYSHLSEHEYEEYLFDRSIKEF